MVSVMAVALYVPSAEAQWRLAQPHLTIGQDSVEFFEDIADILVRDDRVYVADGGLRRIAAFDRATGQLTATAGRRGEGPGDFRFLSWIDDCGGDTIFASDRGLDRVSVFSQELDHIRTFRVAYQRLTAIQCAGTGGFVGITRNQDPQLSLNRAIPMEPWRATHDIVLLEPNGTFRRVLGTFLGQERHREANASGTGYTDYPLHWGLTTVFDSSPRGFVVGTGDTSSLVRYDASGNVLDTLTLEEDRVAVSSAHIDAHVREQVQRAGLSGRDVVRTRSYWEEYPYTSRFPAYSKAVLAADGVVWVERFPEPFTEQPSHWKVFAPDGTLVATVEVPRHFELMWVGETHAAGVVTDELDVQTVEVRLIERD